jgi:hypothetical protein
VLHVRTDGDHSCRQAMSATSLSESTAPEHGSFDWYACGDSYLIQHLCEPEASATLFEQVRDEVNFQEMYHKVGIVASNDLAHC